MRSLLLFLLRAYQLAISPFLGQNCRFYPSCSSYAELAIRRHGVLKGCALTGRRLCKCHPWHAGGVDLVPELQTKSGNTVITDVLAEKDAAHSAAMNPDKLTMSVMLSATPDIAADTTKITKLSTRISTTLSTTLSTTAATK